MSAPAYGARRPRPWKIAAAAALLASMGLWLARELHADGICYNCMMMNGGWFGAAPFYTPMGMYPMPSFYPSYYPWWAGYGALSYSNFFYPGPWNMGIRGGMYPGAGGAFAAKPNLYVSGPEGTKVTVRVQLGQGSNWLAAIPLHGKTGWSATLGRNGTLATNHAEYRYFYYDYRLGTETLQDKSGFCTGPEDLVPALSKALAQSGFRKEEIRDFEEYWSVKIPPSQRYCVFPQESRDLAAGASLEVEPKPSQVTRLLFMVVPGETLTRTDSKFVREPSQEWKPDAESREPASRDSAGIAIREWGVGFLAGKP